MQDKARAVSSWPLFIDEAGPPPPLSIVERARHLLQGQQPVHEASHRAVGRIEAGRVEKASALLFTPVDLSPLRDPRF